MAHKVLFLNKQNKQENLLLADAISDRTHNQENASPL